MQQTAIFQKTYDFYKHFYDVLRRIPKRDRFTWGEKCENIVLESLMLATKSTYLFGKEKYPVARELSFKIDMLKIMLHLGNELKIIGQRVYLEEEKELLEIGRMVGGWLKILR
jgi:hypothetical protein